MSLVPTPADLQPTRRRHELPTLPPQCRTMVTADSALAESVRTARAAGRAWSQIAAIVEPRATLTTWRRSRPRSLTITGASGGQPNTQ